MANETADVFRFSPGVRELVRSRCGHQLEKAQTAFAQALQILRCVVSRAVNDLRVLRNTALDLSSIASKTGSTNSASVSGLAFSRPNSASEIFACTAPNRGYRTGSALAGSQAIPTRFIEAEQLPPILRSLEDGDLKTPVHCPITNLFYAFQQPELEFYHKLGIPLPRTHWRARIQALRSESDLMLEHWGWAGTGPAS